MTDQDQDGSVGGGGAEWNEIVVYQPDEATRLEVRVLDETVWLTQGQMTELFQSGFAFNRRVDLLEDRMERCLAGLDVGIIPQLVVRDREWGRSEGAEAADLRLGLGGGGGGGVG